MIRLHKFKLHVCKDFRCLVRIQTTSSEHENISTENPYRFPEPVSPLLHSYCLPTIVNDEVAPAGQVCKLNATS